jgi:hypothetical protein
VGRQESRVFIVTVPDGTQVLEATMTGSEDADLYVKHGSMVSGDEYGRHDGPTFKAPYLGSSRERVSFTDPSAGTWYVLVRGFGGSDYILTVRWGG